MNQAVTTIVRELRQQQGVSLRRLEALTGISRATWSQIENGKLLPEPRYVAALSEALGVPAAEWRLRFVLEREESA